MGKVLRLRIGSSNKFHIKITRNISTYFNIEEQKMLSKNDVKLNL